MAATTMPNAPQLPTLMDPLDMGKDPSGLQAQPGAAASWSYVEAFSRNLGFVDRQEQERLRNSRIAIAGLGGVGGLHLLTLARLGIGRFTVADFDVFEIANTNRQCGASVSTLGRSKVDVMAALVRDIFEVEARRVLFRTAAQLGLHAISAGPCGYGAAWLIFAPDGMSFDRYFDLSDDMEDIDKVIAFLMGSSPRALHRAYLDFSCVRFRERRVPSTAAGCHLAAAAVAAEAARILLRHPGVRPVPWYCQFDPYRRRFVQGRLWGGNRNPWQRCRRWWLKRQLCAE